MADINKINSKVALISKEFTEIVTKMEKMAANGDSFQKIYKAIAENVERQKKETSSKLGQITQLSNITKKLLETDKLETKERIQQTRSLRKLNDLEKELRSSRENALNTLQKIGKEQSKERMLKAENDKKVKASDLERKKSTEGVSDALFKAISEADLVETNPLIVARTTL